MLSTISCKSCKDCWKNLEIKNFVNHVIIAFDTYNEWLKMI